MAQTLPDPESVLHDVQPTPVLRRAAEPDSLDQLPRPRRTLRRTLPACGCWVVEIVAHEGARSSRSGPPAGQRLPPPSPPSSCACGPSPGARRTGPRRTRRRCPPARARSRRVGSAVAAYASLPTAPAARPCKPPDGSKGFSFKHLFRYELRFRAESPSTRLSFCRRSRFFSVRLTVSWLVSQLHNLPGQRPQRPVGVPLLPLVQGDDLGFRLAASSAPAASASVPAPDLLRRNSGERPSSSDTKTPPQVGSPVGVGLQKGRDEPSRCRSCGSFRGGSRVPRPSAVLLVHGIAFP